MNTILAVFVTILALILGMSDPASAVDINDYSITPPFIQETIKPNMLFMIDNSASMYDLSYVDEGRKTCSNATATSCTKDSECPSGGTCSNFLRQPYYCYDQTYQTSKTYIGNFDPAKLYQYSSANQDFEEVTTFSCTAGAGQEAKSVTGTLCVIYANTSPYAVSTFLASGNYLNWLTASKFDVEKRILTGGKYVGTQLLSESRGCVGQSFIKEANTGNFVNFSSPETNNTNTSLGITFGVRGPYDPYNKSAPSPGGQTYVDIYKGNYNQADCQNAVYQLQYGGNADIKQAVEACLNYSGGGTQSAVVKTKVAFQQSMQACWQYRNGHDIGTDDINTVKNQCTDIYAGFATCSNNPDQVCTADANCGSGNTCIYGPPAIVPGNPALLCGNDYEGQYYYLSSGSGVCQKNNSPDMGACTSQSDCTAPGYKCVGAAGSTWSLKAGVLESDMIQTHRDFCNNLAVPSVVDPTDAPSDTALYDNLPAIISGIGVEAQLNQPIATYSVRAKKDTAPLGLVQNFDGLIRMGLMSFNFNGSATESGSSLPTTKVCSNDKSKVCTSSIDCLSPGTCAAATSGTENKDGAAILHYIGYGHCSTTTTTECATKANCPSGEKCISDGVGDHATGMVKALDDLKATSWTPFAESFYNAIGYFGKSSSDATGKTSRTDLRINATDFSDTLNPSEYVCQNNNILLISDGMSTADRNTSVDNLAKLYTAAGGSTSWTSTCPQYAGSVNLDNLAWIAKNRNINSFSTSSASTATPQEKNESIKTYVVFNGSSNGQSGECNSETLMTNTATNGGTTLYQAEDPASLSANIEAALKEIAAGSASGTAASIVSNRGQSGANLITAIFYPEKDFGKDTSGIDQKRTWIGDLQNYWYYFDPYIANSTIREDTNGDKILDLKDDYRIDFIFDDSTSKTVVKRYRDNGSGSYTLINQVEPEALNALWKAGVELYKRDLTITPYRKLLVNKAGTLFTLTNDKFATLTSTLWTDIKDYLNVSDNTTAENVMKYIYGFDVTGYRKRTVSGYAGVTTADASTGKGVWKLGDVVTSTPKIQADRPLSGYHLDYGDASYESYIASNDYTGRGMVYVGANDGALHAIVLGKVTSLSGGARKAQLTGSGVGTEEWAFVPGNALPYLKYFTDPNYTHLYYVDTTTLVLDASIHKPTACSATNYWDCAKNTVTSSGNLSLDATSWRTVLIGSMGLGGASRAADATCSNCVKAPINVVGFKEHGLSSVFALNVTDPKNPSLMWEFSHPDLGYTTSEPAIVRINGKMDSSTDRDPNKNGRWFAVFASGPTGPIDAESHQFMGKSDKPLKFFVVDIAAVPPFIQNSNYWIIDTLNDGNQIENAFGGSLATNAIDTDKGNRYSSGFYSTDVVYAGYVKPKTVSGVTSWTDGGLLRLLTKEDPNPANWVLSKVIDGVGPVTASIEKLYDDADKLTGKPVLWLYFGSGRYFFKNNTDGIDSADNQMAIYGVKEPCYTVSKDMDQECTTSVSTSALTNQSSNTPNVNLLSGETGGWYINLDGTGTFGSKDFKAERVITTPSVRTNGLLQFTTFKPTADICGFGGETMFWLLNYATGAAPPVGTLKGKITIQLSTGAIVVIDLSKLTSSSFSRGGRQIDVGVGKPPAPPPPADTLKKPVKKVLHIQER
jgi:type IV pilus assembly protein PilY1